MYDASISYFNSSPSYYQYCNIVSIKIQCFDDIGSTSGGRHEKECCWVNCKLSWDHGKGGSLFTQQYHRGSQGAAWVAKSEHKCTITMYENVPNVW